VVVAVVIFFWAVNHQQFEDMDSPAMLPLMEDDPDTPPDTAPAEATDAASATAPSRDPHTPGPPPAQP